MKKREDYLLPPFSFKMGMRSTVDLLGIIDTKYFIVSDERALKDDWEKVAADIVFAMRRFERDFKSLEE